MMREEKEKKKKKKKNRISDFLSFSGVVFLPLVQLAPLKGHERGDTKKKVI